MSENLKRLLSEEDRLVSEVDGKKLMEYTAGIAQWVRISGTKEEVESLEYCQKILDGFGYTTKLVKHPALISYPKKSFVEMESPESMSFESIAHAFTPSTPPGGVSAEIVTSDFPAVAGKIVLCSGMPAPLEVENLEKQGAVGILYQGDDYLHNIPVNKFWGPVGEAEEKQLSQIPVLSVTKASGETIRARIAKGRTRVRLESVIETGWHDITRLDADLPAEGTDKFVIFSGHICSWDYGAMDNGSANATMIECARLLAQKRGEFKRSLKFMFWPGHTQGKFAGSVWYADENFEELTKNCVGYVNVDSTGGKDATIIIEAPVMPQTFRLAKDIIKRQTGEDFLGKRIAHFADQSFFGVGLTSTFGTFSEQDARKAPEGGISFHGSAAKYAGGLGWWWHTKHDTIDKVDEAFLVRDTKIYAATVWRILTQPVLPYNVTDAASDICSSVESLQKEVGNRFDLQPLAKRSAEVLKLAEKFQKELDAANESGTDAEALNDKLHKVLTQMVRIIFHDNDIFVYDPSGPMTGIPSLADSHKLATTAVGSHRYYTSLIKFRRGYNRVMFYLDYITELLK